jgi:hypothetical protein
MTEHRQDRPWPFRPYPPIRAIVERLRRKMGPRFNLNHHINQALGQAHGIEPGRLDEYKRTKGDKE